jgi:hypothetical protein
VTRKPPHTTWQSIHVKKGSENERSHAGELINNLPNPPHSKPIRQSKLVYAKGFQISFKLSYAIVIETDEAHQLEGSDVPSPFPFQRRLATERRSSFSPRPYWLAKLRDIWTYSLTALLYRVQLKWRCCRMTLPSHESLTA